MKTIQVNGESLEIKEDRNLIKSIKIGEHSTFTVTKDLLDGVEVKNVYLKNYFHLEICDYVTKSGKVVVINTPLYLHKLTDNKVEIYIEETYNPSNWSIPIDMNHYLSKKREVLIKRAENLGDINITKDETTEVGTKLIYSMTLEGTYISELVLKAEQVLKEINGSVDIAFGSTFKSIDNLENEADFTLSILIPLIRKMGFSNVKYNHGKKEYGKDIIFSRVSEFGFTEYFGVQVKFGDISGGAASDIDNILGQIDDAFSMSFFDIYTQKKVHISNLLIIISGKFKENAIEKISEKLINKALKNNTYFFDREKVESLIEQYKHN
ncbi:hypothetical protein IEO_05554 [Bacillus wiedmannii]|uniref:hypothetical protein n=1 Tax=Bacillus wiedmannii TaxID=1890302 RepID=UPI00027C193A|nr:hypothetical protein [Bacillus wiedmannii]EJV56053.1 hypothetical protein IEO_05554 [Bacillus wiedmannii]